VKQSSTLFPGANVVLGLYYNKEISGIDIISDTSEFSISKDHGFEQWYSLLGKYRSQRPRYSWININYDPLESISTQLNIQSEYNHHTLILRFPNSHDGLQDIIMISFKNEEQIFRIGKDSQKLSTELKQSIATVYVRMLDVIKKQMEDDHEIYSVIQDYNLNLMQADDFNARAQDEWKFKHIKLVRSILAEKVKEMELPEDLSVNYADDAVAYLADNYDDVRDLEKSIRNSLIIALNQTDARTKNIQIQKNHVVILNRDTSRKKETNIDTRFNRTITLLDRYENAASLVINEKLKLTGNNLGAHLNPSISAAAISDAIRKHASKITYLLNKYPTRWSILRGNFTPIQNKLYAKHEFDQKAS
jgi:hypothetical protein